MRGGTAMLNVLVTGAAGLIGGELCARLVERGHTVTALVHRQSEVRDNDGVPVSGITIVGGDVTQPGLGILPPQKLDVVIHCAAALEFDAPYDTLASVNVEGTHHAAALTKATGARLLHVSTAYVCGLAEGRIAEAPVREGTRFANNYEASKAAAEMVVRDAGVGHAIARVAIVLGDSETGAIREFPAICTLFRLMARGAIRQLPIARGATLDLVPVDFVTRALVRLAERMNRADGAIIHVASGAPMRARALPEALGRFPHLPMARAVLPEAFELAALPSAEQRVLGQLLASYGGYLARAPLFATDRLRQITGLACLPTDEAWLDRLIGYGIARGYLPAPGEPRSGAQRTSG